jgi:hypothetical protein
MSLELSDLDAWVNRGQRAVRTLGLGVSLQESGQKERGGRYALGSSQSAAAGQKKEKDRQCYQPQKFPI